MVHRYCRGAEISCMLNQGIGKLKEVIYGTTACSEFEIAQHVIFKCPSNVELPGDQRIGTFDIALPIVDERRVLL